MIYLLGGVLMLFDVLDLVLLVIVCCFFGLVLLLGGVVWLL